MRIYDEKSILSLRLTSKVGLVKIIPKEASEESCSFYLTADSASMLSRGIRKIVAREIENFHLDGMGELTVGMFRKGDGPIELKGSSKEKSWSFLFERKVLKVNVCPGHPEGQNDKFYPGLEHLLEWMEWAKGSIFEASTQVLEDKEKTGGKRKQFGVDKGQQPRRRGLRRSHL